MTNRIQIDIIRDVEGNAGNVEGNSGNVEGCSGNVESYSGNVEGCSGNMESCSGMALTITSLLAGTMVYSQKKSPSVVRRGFYHEDELGITVW